jgi:hypothetical protein
LHHWREVFGRGLLAVVELNAMGAGARKASLLGNSAKPHTMKLLSPSLTENSASLGERGEPVRSMTLGDSLRIALPKPRGLTDRVSNFYSAL